MLVGSTLLTTLGQFRPSQSSNNMLTLLADNNTQASLRRVYPESPNNHINPRLRIVIPESQCDSITSGDVAGCLQSAASTESGVDSLFDGDIDMHDEACSSPSLDLDTRAPNPIPASLVAPPIPGLFFNPELLLPRELTDAVMKYCLKTYFRSPAVNQVMLFGRHPQPLPDDGTESTAEDLACLMSCAPPKSGLPAMLLTLLAKLSAMLKSLLPPETHALLFPREPKQPRQAILNLYEPGEGISPHVDLLNRFGDGIVGVSMGSGCVMRFAREGVAPGRVSDETNARDIWDLYLPERSLVVLSKDARYEWSHGIGKETRDYIAVATGNETEGRWVERDTRLSITFRWLLPGADVVGGDQEPQCIDDCDN